MCQSEKHNACKQPERLRGKPGECSPEQIQECHGHDKEHTCCQEG